MFDFISDAYSSLVNLVIRPERRVPKDHQLGPKDFVRCGRTWRRTDLTLVNDRGQRLICCHYTPVRCISKSSSSTSNQQSGTSSSKCKNSSTEVQPGGNFSSRSNSPSKRLLVKPSNNGVSTDESEGVVVEDHDAAFSCAVDEERQEARWNECLTDVRQHEDTITSLPSGAPEAGAPGGSCSTVTEVLQEDAMTPLETSGARFTMSSSRSIRNFVEKHRDSDMDLCLMEEEEKSFRTGRGAAGNLPAFCSRSNGSSFQQDQDYNKEYKSTENRTEYRGGAAGTASASSRPPPCVVYLHGNASCRLEAKETWDYVLSLGFSLFAFDFSGSGNSDGDYVSLGFYEREDLHTVVTHLREQDNVGPIMLWGRSMGAFTALSYCAKYGSTRTPAGTSTRPPEAPTLFAGKDAKSKQQLSTITSAATSTNSPPQLVHDTKSPIVGLVCDSSFSNFRVLARELVESFSSTAPTAPELLVNKDAADSSSQPNTDVESSDERMQSTRATATSSSSAASGDSTAGAAQRRARADSDASKSSTASGSSSQHQAPASKTLLMSFGLKMVGSVGLPLLDTILQFIRSSVQQRAEFDIDELFVCPEKLRLPVYFLAGTKDTFIRPRHTQFLFDNWGGCDKALDLMQNADHNSRRQAVYLTRVCSFLKRVGNQTGIVAPFPSPGGQLHDQKINCNQQKLQLHAAFSTGSSSFPRNSRRTRPAATFGGTTSQAVPPRPLSSPMMQVKKATSSWSSIGGRRTTATTSRNPLLLEKVAQKVVAPPAELSPAIEMEDVDSDEDKALSQPPSKLSSSVPLASSDADFPVSSPDEDNQSIDADAASGSPSTMVILTTPSVVAKSQTNDETKNSCDAKNAISSSGSAGARSGFATSTGVAAIDKNIKFGHGRQDESSCFSSPPTACRAGQLVSPSWSVPRIGAQGLLLVNSSSHKKLSTCPAGSSFVNSASPPQFKLKPISASLQKPQDSGKTGTRLLMSPPVHLKIKTSSIAKTSTSSASRSRFINLDEALSTSSAAALRYRPGARAATTLRGSQTTSTALEKAALSSSSSATTAPASAAQEDETCAPDVQTPGAHDQHEGAGEGAGGGSAASSTTAAALSDADAASSSRSDSQKTFSDTATNLPKGAGVADKCEHQTRSTGRAGEEVISLDDQRAIGSPDMQRVNMSFRINKKPSLRGVATTSNETSPSTAGAALDMPRPRLSPGPALPQIRLDQPLFPLPPRSDQIPKIKPSASGSSLH
ncbi:unnamed protein product [Amoebophrya sp. A120]|nr:unnamed protein product [Amoebophrya sp. A120]|eukprot:GSA120T00018379001.1